MISFSNGGYQIFGRKHFHCSMTAAVRNMFFFKVGVKTDIKGLLYQGCQKKATHSLTGLISSTGPSTGLGQAYCTCTYTSSAQAFLSFSSQKPLIQQLLWMYRYFFRWLWCNKLWKNLHGQNLHPCIIELLALSRTFWALKTWGQFKMMFYRTHNKKQRWAFLLKQCSGQ